MMEQWTRSEGCAHIGRMGFLTGTKRKVIEIESYLPTVYLFASFEEI
jgi:hypothetical protein